MVVAREVDVEEAREKRESEAAEILERRSRFEEMNFSGTSTCDPISGSRRQSRDYLLRRSQTCPVLSMPSCLSPREDRGQHEDHLDLHNGRISPKMKIMTSSGTMSVLLLVYYV